MTLRPKAETHERECRSLFSAILCLPVQRLHFNTRKVRTSSLPLLGFVLFLGDGTWLLWTQRCILICIYIFLLLVYRSFGFFLMEAVRTLLLQSTMEKGGWECFPVGTGPRGIYLRGLQTSLTSFLSRHTCSS